MSGRVFSDPEFLRSMHVIPFDEDADRLREHRLAFEATVMFHRAQEREQSVRFFRGVLGSVGFVVLFGSILYWAWCAL